MSPLKGIFLFAICCLILVLAGQRTLLAENKKDQFMAEEAYDYLFDTAMKIIGGDPGFNGVIVMISNTYDAEPRLKPYHRPRRTEYTSFSFDGYWMRHARSRDPIGLNNWDRDEKKFYEEDNTPGRWHFRVRWTTRKENTINWGQINVIQFGEVMPDVYFLEHGGLKRRHDFSLINRFPDKHHKEVGYVNGVWIIFGGPNPLEKQ